MVLYETEYEILISGVQFQTEFAEDRNSDVGVDRK